MKILFIDDDVSLTRLLKASLTKKGGYQVAVENNSRHALQTAREFQPDLIVLDIVMPDKDGGDVAQALKDDARTKSIPIIFLSSIVSKKEQAQTYSAAAEKFLAKPVTVDELVGEIERTLAE